LGPRQRPKGRNAAVIQQHGRNAAVLSDRDHATAVAAAPRATPQSRDRSLHNAVFSNVVNLLCDAAHFLFMRDDALPNRKGPIPGALLIGAASLDAVSLDGS
jgi:hypothetical protein